MKSRVRFNESQKVQLSNKEINELRSQIKEQAKSIFAEYDRKQANEFDAVILWVLHKDFGFGAVRLKRFYDQFSSGIDDLLKRYELSDIDLCWLCTRLLLDEGIDVAQWRIDKEKESVINAQE